MNRYKDLPYGNTHVIDDLEVEDAEPKRREHADATDVQPKRGRGRPKGSVAKISEDHDLSLSDFSFLRAVIQGIDAKKAAVRYLTSKNNFSAHACAKYEYDIRSLIQRTIKVLLSEADQTQANAHLAVLNAPALKATPIGPSLTDFAERWDCDMYSEAELQAMYMEEFGNSMSGEEVHAGESVNRALKAKIEAVNWLADHIAKKPNGTDPVELWINADLIKKLRVHGILTVGNLMDWVNIQGRTFFRKIPGFGTTRARRLALWLMDNEESIGRRLSRRIRFEKTDTSTAQDVAVREHSTPSHEVQTIQEFGIVPLDRLAWPPSLLGQGGVFRGPKQNTLGATNDLEAIRAWFAALEVTASAATRTSYERAIERLVLWAIVEKRTPLSSLMTESFVEFREFLRNPPPQWCTRLPTIKESPDWRPLRGPMKEASIQQTFSAISAFFAVLTGCSYLTANAVASVRTSSKRDMRMDVMRSFAEEDLDAIARTMREMEEGPNKRRLRAIILLLQTGGFRRGEAIALKYSHLTQARKDNKISETWVAKFFGKGGKERQVPIKAQTYAALQAHYRDRLDLIENGRERVVNGVVKTSNPPLAAFKGISMADSPLLSILDDRMAQGRDASAGETAGNARVRRNLDGAMSNGLIHVVLKEFFKKVGERRDLVEGHANFEKASAHWLRHTFGLQAMIASDGDLAGIQQILGHSDISTTGIYLKANLDSRVAIVEGIRAAV